MTGRSSACLRCATFAYMSDGEARRPMAWDDANEELLDFTEG